MAHFLVKIGRNPVAQNAVPVAICGVSTVYLCAHFYGHSFFKNAFTSFTDVGYREIPTEHLKSLVKSVENDMKKSDFNQCFFPNDAKLKGEYVNPPIYRFFISSTLEPISIGLTQSKNGVTIGIPQHFNYMSVIDLPHRAFVFITHKFFKKIKGEENEKEDKDTAEFLKTMKEMGVTDSKTGELKIMNPDSEIGRSYAETLILSDPAKKFAIAKELFKVDTFESAFKVINFSLSCLVGLALSRFLVLKLKLRDVHVKYRLLSYFFGTTSGISLWKINSALLDRYYEEMSIKRTLSLGPEYCIGATEFYTKCSSRNKLLRGYLEEKKREYDIDGNKNDFSGVIKLNYARRLELAREYADNFNSKQGNESVASNKE